MKEIEIPFGACDSELDGFEYTIPEGYEAEIKDGKIVVRKIESEDEKIRKEILDYIIKGSESCYDIQQYGREKFEKWIAWLEKQGEQKPYGQREECLDCQMNYAGECKGSCAMKRGEQKPADTEKGANGNEREIPNSAWSEEDEENLNWFEKFFRAESVVAEGKDIPQDRYLWFKNLKERVQPKPKQEWSEEDKENLDRIITIIHCYTGTVEEEIKLTNWLKSLKDRVIPQSKQEFSEYDEYEIDTILAHLKACLNEYTYSRYEKQLKSLRPQSYWKPSIAQLNALSIVSKGNAPDDIEAIVSLYNDLNKLKG